jgi:hypothetical protein
MKGIDKKLLRKLRIVFLLLGVFVSWFATLSAFREFYGYEGTIFKIRDCVIPNPVTTPCFWGALAFAGGLVWAYKRYGSETKKFEKNFLYFMIFSIIFAWSNFVIELRGVEPKPGSLIAPCQASANPFTSACFFGSILFTLSFLTTLLLVKKLQK